MSAISEDPLGPGSSQALLQKIAFVPQRLVNSYTPELGDKLRMNGIPLHAVWEPGDFLIALSGCGRLASSSDCEHWLNKFGVMGWINFKDAL